MQVPAFALVSRHGLRPARVERMPRHPHRATGSPRAGRGGPLAVLTCAALLAAGTLAGATPGSAAWTGTNGRIAYDHVPSDGNTRIWTSNPDGTDPGPILFDETAFDAGSLLGVNSPEWAPDGRHLVTSLFLNCDYGANCSNEIG
ncbi:MAG: hypothetical protein QOD68_2346, partial [Actinomycetota bacterium]|nr:hypothetical protein [Actinomycetota bacterium]